MKTLTAFLLTVFLSIQLTAQTSVGETAPDFTLTRLDGTGTVTLSDLEGKVVYIFFYGAGCPHCKTNGPVTETQIYQSFKDNDNFVALGIDTWNYNASSNQSFKSVTGITYPLLLNGGQVLVDYYGTSGAYDRSVVVSADGVLRYKGTGFVNTDYETVMDVIEDELDNISTSLAPDLDRPTAIQLNQNYPNPFNPETVISYSIPTSENVALRIFNSLGQEIAVLVNAFQTAGSHTVSWNASSQTSGIYFYRLETSGSVITKKMMLIK